MSVDLNIQNRHFPDDPKPSDHLKFLTWGETDPYTALGLRRFAARPNTCSERFRRSQKQSLRKLCRWVDELQGEERVYLTQACYHWSNQGDKNRYRTTSAYLASVSVIFVDLDLYNAVEKFGDSPTDQEFVVNAVLETCRNVGVPDPLLVSSGRGMYAYWALSERLDLNQQDVRKRWKTAQRRLMTVLGRFAPDPKVVDLTRILRLVGTVNEKNGAVVSVLYDDGKRHSLDHLEQRLKAIQIADESKTAHSVTPSGPKGRKASTLQSPSEKMKPTELTCLRAEESYHSWTAPSDAIAWLMSLIDRENAAYAQLNVFQRLYYRLFRDIATVVKARGGIRIGERDEVIFWMLVCRYHAGLCPVEELNDWAKKFSTLTEGELVLSSSSELRDLESRMRRDSLQAHATGKIVHTEVVRRIGGISAVRYVMRYRTPPPIQLCPNRAHSAVYAPSIRTLLQRLAITSSEQLSLETLIDDAERKRRRSMTLSKENRRLRREETVRRVKNGEHVERIARELKICRSSVYRYLNDIEKVKGQSKKGASAESTPPRSDALEKCRKRLSVIEAVRNEPTLSLREVARRTGVPLTTVHRWLTSGDTE